MFYRLSILAQDMANMQSRVDDVNKAVKQLEDNRHPRTKEVKDCQVRLNKRWVWHLKRIKKILQFEESPQSQGFYVLARNCDKVELVVVQLNKCGLEIFFTVENIDSPSVEEVTAEWLVCIDSHRDD